LPLLIEAAINISLNTELAFNVREVAIYFLEQIGDSFAKHLTKKHPLVLKEVIAAGFKLACEDDSEFPDEEESPHSLSLYMLHNFAIEVPLPIIYPLFKDNIILFCKHQEDALVRKAGLKILGQICDSDGLLDGIKDDIDVFTDLLVAGMQDQSEKVREASAFVVGQFSEHVVPDFLDRHAKIVPVLFKVLESHLSLSTLSADHALHTEKAIYSVKEFVEQMHETEVKPYLEQGI
jgi:HEAT repeat protein